MDVDVELAVGAEDQDVLFLAGERREDVSDPRVERACRAIDLADPDVRLTQVQLGSALTAPIAEHAGRRQRSVMEDDGLVKPTAHLEVFAERLGQFDCCRRAHAVAIDL